MSSIKVFKMLFMIVEQDVVVIDKMLLWLMNKMLFMIDE